MLVQNEVATKKLVVLKLACDDFGCELRKMAQPPHLWVIRDKIEPKSWFLAYTSLEVKKIPISAILDSVIMYQENALGCIENQSSMYKHPVHIESHLLSNTAEHDVVDYMTKYMGMKLLK